MDPIGNIVAGIVVIATLCVLVWATMDAIDRTVAFREQYSHEHIHGKRGY